MITRWRSGTGLLAVFAALGVNPVAEMAGAQDQTPAPRAHHQLVYHAGRDRALLIGGSTPVDDGHRYFDDVWSWDGERWTAEDPLPFPRSSHRVVYAAGRGSLLLFGGGFASAVRSEGVIWEHRDGRWKALGGRRAAGRAEPGVCYDRRRESTVIFGGWDVAGDYRADTWEWDGRELARADSTGPSPRLGHAFVCDPARERCLLFAGRGPDGYHADAWTWDGDAWHGLDVEGPSPRWFFGAASDPGQERIVVFGGMGPDGDLGDTWALDAGGWHRLSTGGPPPRSMAKLAYTGRTLVLFGGRRDTPDGFVDMNDTWLLGADGWSRR